MPGGGELRRVVVEGLKIDVRSGAPVLMLREKAGDLRRLPIWIGDGQARSIASALDRIEPPRPNTHDLIVSMLGGLQSRVERVTVTELREGTYYALIKLVGGPGLDARPSDAIAIAVRMDTPIFVADSVLDGGIPLLDEENAMDIDWQLPRRTQEVPERIRSSERQADVDA